MIIVHFIKRLLECIIIHNFSRNTKTFSRLIWELAYYWLFCGVGITYYLLHPNYQKPLWEVESLYFVKYILIASFIFCELMNLQCHIHLRELRVGKENKIGYIGFPTLHGFSSVSAANYFWEFCAWVIFAFTIQSLTAYLFVFASFLRMNHRAQKKHRRYIADYRKQYPSDERTAFIPYLF